MDTPDLVGVDLEDSWVLGWHFDRPGRRLTFHLEASLWPGHARYEAPPPGTHTCYKRASLVFDGVADLQGLLPQDGVHPTREANGSPDYGAIEGFQAGAGGRCRFGGDFGQVSLRCDAVRLEIASGARPPA